MRKFALIGQDISYSLSPFIHGEIFKKMDYSASYELISVPADGLPALVEKLRAEYDGFNVTKPHKQNIIPFLDGNPPKSVNTVKIEGDKMYGFSTDGYGFEQDVKIRFGKIYGKAMVLGAGGVARVVAKELKDMGLDVYIWNRTREKAEALAAELGVRFAERQDIKPDFTVNCTSCGFKRGENPAVGKGEDGGDYVLVDELRVKWAYDTIYSPPVTDFLRHYSSAKTANGYGMLVLQAIEADRIMCGFEIDEMLERELYSDIMDKIISRQRLQ